MQHYGHALPVGYFLAGSLVHLYGEDESEEKVQPIHPHPFPLASDQTSKLKQIRDKETCLCLWSLEGSI